MMDIQVCSQGSFKIFGPARLCNRLLESSKLMVKVKPLCTKQNSSKNVKWSKFNILSFFPGEAVMTQLEWTTKKFFNLPGVKVA